ncbi:hypothetical protein ACJIZ3_012631 [Penstemon smallii]|uniref:Prephenate dehydratase domain-containing protein n=1 Tax=Penstemon smallii TaxID=265156 RepID=A0ABD3UML3_9LAMI
MDGIKASRSIFHKIRQSIPLYLQIKHTNPNPVFTLNIHKRRRNIPLRARGGEANQRSPIFVCYFILFNLILLDIFRPSNLSNLASKGSGLRVAHQRGAYSESAAEKAYPNCEAVPCEQFDTVFEAVESWLVDRAVFPIENSLGGSIHRNYDLLLRHKLHIVGEAKLQIRHCLLANHGVEALALCENTLTKFGLVREAVDDTACAAKVIKLIQSETKVLNMLLSTKSGCWGSCYMTAAKIYGLNILSQDIQDDSDNITRFLMLARETIIPVTHRPGMLFMALAVFATRNINLTKIESRPLQMQALQTLDGSSVGSPKHFPYLFYVEFEASMADEKIPKCPWSSEYMRVLGSYPSDTGLP